MFQSLKQTKLLTSILRESKRLNTARRTEIPTTSKLHSTENVQPVLFNEKDLHDCAPPNASPSFFGIQAARCLWSDEEIKNGRLGILKRKRGRPSLDPERQNLWVKACQARFDEDGVTEAQAAVITNSVMTSMSANVGNLPNTLVQ